MMLTNCAAKSGSHRSPACLILHWKHLGKKEKGIRKTATGKNDKLSKEAKLMPVLQWINSSFEFTLGLDRTGIFRIILQTFPRMVTLWLIPWLFSLYHLVKDFFATICEQLECKVFLYADYIFPQLPVLCCLFGV